MNSTTQLLHQLLLVVVFTCASMSLFPGSAASKSFSFLPFSSCTWKKTKIHNSIKQWRFFLLAYI